MTSAPLPAPLPANCPLCNEPITWGDELWIHTDTDRCFLDGTTLHNDEEVRLWNRRAPEAQAWRAIDGEIEKAPWRHVVISNAGTTEALLVYCDDKGRGWLGFNNERPVTIAEIVETGPIGQFFATHYLIVTDPTAPPGATPAAPPACEAALVEALREAWEQAAITAEYTSLPAGTKLSEQARRLRDLIAGNIRARGENAVATARAALAEGRAG